MTDSMSIMPARAEKICSALMAAAGGISGSAASGDISGPGVCFYSSRGSPCPGMLKMLPGLARIIDRVLDPSLRFSWTMEEVLPEGSSARGLEFVLEESEETLPGMTIRLEPVDDSFPKPAPPAGFGDFLETGAVFTSLQATFRGVRSAAVDVLEARGDLESQYEEFNSLYEQLHWFHHIAASIKSVHDITALAEEIFSTAEALFLSIEASALFLAEPGGELLPAGLRGNPFGIDMSSGWNPFEGIDPLLIAVHATGIAVMNDDGDMAGIPVESVSSLRSQPFIAVPLIGSGGPQGVLLVTGSEGFSENDRNLFLKMGEQAARAIENNRLYRENLEKQRIENDLKVAHEIQQRLLPKRYPPFHGVDIFGMNRPAKVVGGDLFDVFDLEPDNPGKRLGVVVADVAGKGISASIIMAMTRSSLRAAAMGHRSPKKVFEVVNRQILEDTQSGLYVTVFYGVLDLETMEFTFAKAGHNPPLLLRSGGEIDTLECPGLFLGMFEDGNFGEATVTLRSGDRLLLFTDGVVEAMDSEGVEFKVNRLVDSLKDATRRGFDAHATVGEIFRDVARFTSGIPPHDDFTLLVLDIRNPVSRRTLLSPDRSSMYEAIDRIASDLAKCGVGDSDLLAIRMAMDESLTNSILHSGSPESGESDPVESFFLGFDLVGDIVTITFDDTGRGFDYTSAMGCVAGMGVMEMDRFGLYMINMLMDEVCYRDGGRGITMRKKLKSLTSSNKEVASDQ